jgi:hypothetical protein
MEDAEYLQDTHHVVGGGARHPIVVRIANGSVGAVTGALDVALGPGLMSHNGAPFLAPLRTVIAGCRCSSTEGSSFLHGAARLEDGKSSLASRHERTRFARHNPDSAVCGQPRPPQLRGTRWVSRPRNGS